MKKKIVIISIFLMLLMLAIPFASNISAQQTKIIPDQHYFPFGARINGTIKGVYNRGLKGIRQGLLPVNWDGHSAKLTATSLLTGKPVTTDGNYLWHFSAFYVIWEKFELIEEGDYGYNDLYDVKGIAFRCSVAKIPEPE